MAELKTKTTGQSVNGFLNGIEDPAQRRDAKTIAKMMKSTTGSKPKMWGDAIVGYGDLELTYANGKTNPWFRMGFSPRKTSLSLYIMNGFAEYGRLLKKLGKHKTGKSCLYLKRLDDVDLAVLQTVMDASAADLAKKYGN